MSTFTADELRRYDRHLSLPEFGRAGQERLRAARILIVGVGGLGSPAALYLAAAGAGTIGLVDFDEVDESNLQRQILYGTADVGRPKLDVAAARLRALNPHLVVSGHDTPFSAANGAALVSAYDVVIDGSDNFPTRYLVNDACVMARVPNVYGSVLRFEGQAAVFAAPGGPCYRCLHPEPPPDGLIPSCAEGGVLGVLPGVIGTIQATEAIKLVTGIGEPLIGRLLLYDALRMRFRTIDLPRDPDCPVCGDRPVIRDLVAYDQVCEDGDLPGDPGGVWEDRPGRSDPFDRRRAQAMARGRPRARAHRRPRALGARREPDRRRRAHPAAAGAVQARPDPEGPARGRPLQVGRPVGHCGRDAPAEGDRRPQPQGRDTGLGKAVRRLRPKAQGSRLAAACTGPWAFSLSAGLIKISLIKP